MRATRMVALFVFLIGFAASPQAAEPVVPQENAGRIVRQLVQTLPQVHMSQEAISESLMRRTLDNFLRALDFDRTIFKAEDVLELRKRAVGLDAKLKEGVVDFPFEAFALYRERAADRVAYVEKLLEAGFDFEVEESYLWRRKDADWAQGDEEWNELWRLKVKNEIVGLRVSQQVREIEAAEKAEKEKAKPVEEKPEAAEAVEKPEGPSLEAAPDAAPAVVEAAEGAAPAEPAGVRQEDLTPEQRIRKRYTQFVEVLNGHDSEYILDMFLSSLAGAYDAHSSYMSPRREEDFDIQMRLSLTGIGAVLAYDEGAAKIERIMKGGPADRDGRLQPGDKIIAVQQEGEEPVDILYWPLYKSVRLIRGEIGSRVVLHVIPASDATGSRVSLIDLRRDEIKMEEKAARSLIYPLERDGKTYQLGIISLPDFYADFSGKKNGDQEATSSAQDVRRLLRELNQANVVGMVLDLRNNGGGSLPDAVEMTGFFLDSGPVVQVRSGGGRVNLMMDPKNGMEFDKPVVVLVNRLSASASEILAAALQDHGRAVIVGDSKTHGKGTVQSLMPLDRGDETMGAIKVTTAGFYRVDGRSTQLKGVSPDIVIPSPTDVMELGEEFLPNVLPWSWVMPFQFQPAGDLREMNKSLVASSAARLQANDNYGIYLEKVERLAERVRRQEVSLRLADRLEQVLQDRELDKLRDKGLGIADAEVEEEPSVDEEDVLDIRPDEDMVLKEGLHILADILEYVPPVEE